MTLEILVALALAAALSTVGVVRLIPRLRHSPVFDRVLWAATFLVAALGGWLVWGFSSQTALLKPLVAVEIVRVPIIPIVIGALGGAVVLTVPLWLMDRFGTTELPASDDPPLDDTD